MAKRFAIKGQRAGEHIWTAFGRFQSHPVDGGLALGPKEKKAFEDDGYTLIPIADEAPSTAVDSQKQIHDAAYAQALAEAAAAGASAALPTGETLAEHAQREGSLELSDP